MARRAATRLISLVGVLAVLSVAVFVMQAILPSDPVKALYGRNASPELLAQKRQELGFDRSVPEQYVRFVGRIVQGDLGLSLRTRRPVRTDIAQFLPATLELAACAALAAAALGLALGLIGARGGRASGAVRLLSVACSSAPTFFVAIVAILLFYRRLGWLPAGGRSEDPTRQGGTGFLLFDSIIGLDPRRLGDAAAHLVLPSLTLALAPAVAIGRVLRSALLDTMGDEFVRTARIKGLTERAVLLRHALRNALIPTLAMGGLQVGLMLAGAVVVEVVYSWPGVGLYLNQSIGAADFPAVVGVVLVVGAATVLISTAVDVAQTFADPRLRP